jgi:hypothetical protein
MTRLKSLLTAVLMLISFQVSAGYVITAWNDLGMHCVDGKDYSVFSILPPYNNLHAQVMDNVANKIVTTGVTVTYEAFRDPSGSINTSSATKTNFWTYVKPLYGKQCAPNRGLNLSNPAISNPTPSKIPAPLTFNTAQQWWEAEGLPIIPFDDANKKNAFPMVAVKVKNTKTGAVLAQTFAVLPVSDEMSCKSCHASNSQLAAKPPSGWVNYATTDVEKDWKKNILKLHDEKHLTDPIYIAALAKVGVPPTGLYARSLAGTPTLCASCHGTNALGIANMTVLVAGVSHVIPSMTAALHTSHATVKNPTNAALTLDDNLTRDTCYMCHPGAATKCLRGAMSNVPEIECQSCHGKMAAVGNPSRIGWLQEPNCQACHHDGNRDVSAVTNINTGALQNPTDKRYATNPNTPAAGVSLYRFSKGHGNLQCEACHGPTHAENADGEVWASPYNNDMLQSKAVQGYAGPLRECNVCHQQKLTANGGPHGMHTTGQTWVDKHGDFAEGNKSATCKYCHDARVAGPSGVQSNTWRGTKLSMTQSAKTFNAKGKKVTFAAREMIGCYSCHNGPSGGDGHD